MPYLTPDDAPGDLTVTRALSLPANAQWLGIVGGALSELVIVENFEQHGSVTPQECVDFFLVVLSQFYED